MCKPSVIKMSHPKWFIDLPEHGKIQHPIQTNFGLIPEMPMELAGSRVVIIAVRKVGEHQLNPVNICMPHQIYVEKLQKYFDEGAEDIGIFPADLACSVKKDGKKIWIVKR